MNSRLRWRSLTRAERPPGVAPELRAAHTAVVADRTPVADREAGRASCPRVIPDRPRRMSPVLGTVQVFFLAKFLPRSQVFWRKGNST